MGGNFSIKKICVMQIVSMKILILQAGINKFEIQLPEMVSMTNIYKNYKQ